MIKQKTILRNWRVLSFWAVRIYVLSLLLGSILPAEPRATIGPQQHVDTQKPHVCVHTRLIDEVFEWKIQQSLIYVREMGADTIVEFFPWAYIEQADDIYDWTQADKIIRHAQNQGIQVIARMGFVPEWARPDIEAEYATLNYLPEDAYTLFADFVAAFAERYRGVVNHIIIWNEPNLAFEWGYRDVNPEAYARLLEAVYPRVKEANPDIYILAGALAPTLEPLGSPHGLNDITYLQLLYEAGAAPFFDALAVHTYGFTEPPEAEPAFERLNFRRAELLRQIMIDYGDEEKPVFITETGWNDSPRWTKAVRPSQRVSYTIRAYQWAEEQWDWVDKMCIWALRYPTPTNSYPDNFTLITPDFQLKPIYYALQAYARGLGRSDAQWLPPPQEP